MTKLSVFTRITPTRSNIVTLSKVLKKHGFKLTTIRGKRLFEVVEITPEQVKDNFLSTPEEKGTKKEDEKNHTDKSKGNTPALEEKFSLNGRFKNVVLSEAELQELMTLFPWDYQKRIDHLSVYMKSSGKEYQNHFATICLWSERDGARAGRDKYEFQEGESL